MSTEPAHHERLLMGSGGDEESTKLVPRQCHSPHAATAMTAIGISKCILSSRSTWWRGRIPERPPSDVPARTSREERGASPGRGTARSVEPSTQQGMDMRGNAEA